MHPTNSFIPVSTKKLEMRRLSADEIHSSVSLGDYEQDSVSDTPSVPISYVYQPGKYIACMYDQQWYIGTIDERSDENNDVHVKFMTRSKRTGILSWPPDDPTSVMCHFRTYALSVLLRCKDTEVINTNYW